MEKDETDILGIYKAFLESYAEEHDDVSGTLPEKGKFHVYDLAALTLIWKRVTAKSQTDEYSQIIIDEAQDFGPAVYYVLKQVLSGCYFTIMGDVSQNINYETGMNSWEEVKNRVFAGERARFHVLSKSYRNTIEISEYAGKVLEKASFGAYKITPVIRHGRKVEFHPAKSMMCDTVNKLLSDIKERGYDTTAIICRNEEQVEHVRKWLGQTGEQTDFDKGVMVLPIHLTKGLEFDAVILFDPSTEDYRETEGDAKLLYVAVTRALHELHIVYERKLSRLFE